MKEDEMSFLDFLKPARVDDPDPKMRLKAVQKLRAQDERVLKRLAKEDPDDGVRTFAAVCLVEEVCRTQADLIKLAWKFESSEITLAAINSIRDVGALAAIADSQRPPLGDQVIETAARQRITYLSGSPFAL